MNPAYTASLLIVMWLTLKLLAIAVRKRKNKRKTSDHTVLASGTWRRRGWVRFHSAGIDKPGSDLKGR